MTSLRAMQNNAVDKGQLQINVTSEITALPVTGATISISYTGVPESTLEQVNTDAPVAVLCQDRLPYIRSGQIIRK